MKKIIITWLLKKSGIYNHVWEEFCREYPIRISGTTPEVKRYLETQNKVFTDMMIYSMGCTQYVDPRDIMTRKDVVLH